MLKDWLIRSEYTFSFLTVVFCSLCCGSFCENESFKMESDKVSDTYRCLSWNSTIYLKNDSNMRTLEMYFKPYSKYRRCFQFYKVHLYHLWSDHSHYCNAYYGTIINCTIVDATDKEMGVLYSQVRNGSYCFLIEPCSLECFERWSLHSSVVNVYGNDKNEKRLEKENLEGLIHSHKHNHATVEILSICILILVSIGGMLVFWRHKSRKAGKRINWSTDGKKGEEIVVLLEPRNISVYILYTCDKSTKVLVAHLRDFLEKRAEFNVVTIEDELPKIFIDPSRWIREILDYRCTRGKGDCNSNKRFIIVKTEKVAEFLKYDLNASICSKRNNSSDSTSSDESSDGHIQDDWYFYALNSIFIDWSKCFKDYCHLFVVCFDDALCYDELLPNCCPNVRYTIPNQLVDLCIHLSGKSEDEALRKRLMQEIECHPIRHL